MTKTLLLVALLIGSLQDAAVNSTWMFIGPRESHVQQLLPDRTSNGVWYLKSLENHPLPEGGSLYVSFNNGHTWHSRPIGHVGRIVLYPSGSPLYAIIYPTESDLYGILQVSDDRGKTFHPRSELDSFTSDLILHPQKPDVLFRITPYDGPPLKRSLDGGRSWKGLTLPAKSGTCRVSFWDLESAVIDPFNPHRLFVAASAQTEHCKNHEVETGILLQSENLGNTWFVIQELPPAIDGHFPELQFHFDAAFPDRLMLVGSHGIWQRQKSGWIRVSTQQVWDVAAVPGQQHILYGMSTYDPLRSTDGGVNWSIFHPNLANSINLVRVTNNGRELLGATRFGFFRSDITRPFWRSSSTGIARMRDFIRGEVDKGEDNRLYTSIGAVLLRRDHNEWHNLSQNYADPDPLFYFSNLSVNPIIATEVAVILNEGDRNDSVFLSNDAGDTWQKQTLPSGCADYEYSRATYNASGTLYVANGRCLFRKKLGQSNLEALTPAGETIYEEIYPDRKDPNAVLFQTYAGVFWSLNEGNSATKIQIPTPRRLLRFAPLPERHQYLMLTVYGDVLRGSPDSQSWTRLGRSPLITPPDDTNCDNARCYVKRFYAADLRNYYILTNGQFLYHSTDAGRSWTVENHTLPSRYLGIDDITDPAYPPFYVFASDGIYRKN